MNARTTRVLLLVQSPDQCGRVMAAIEMAGLAGLHCGSDNELFETIETARPKLVCLVFDGQCIEDVARLRLLFDLYPRLSILLFQTHATATPPPQDWPESVAGYVELDSSTEQLAREISWCLCVDPAKLQHPPVDAPFFIGRSQAMLQVADAINRLADSSDPILIQGEHGTGKQLAAFELHRQSSRSALTIHILGCEEFEESELEQLLFGPANHTALPPMLQDPQIGTVVLSELAAISPALQSRLIAWLRLNKSLHSTPKIIFTTSRDLGRLVADRKVRADLFLELSNQVIGLPPLRHRPGDIRTLADRFAQHINQYLSSLQRPPLQLESRHYQALESYHWPGNVRELRTAVMSLAFGEGPFDLSGNVRVSLEHKQVLSKKLSSLFNLAPNTTRLNRIADESQTSIGRSQGNSSDDQRYWALIVERFVADKSLNIYARALELFEKELIRQVLDRTGGDLEDSARLLGLTSINLQSKIQHLEIDVPNTCNLE